jgi:cytosine/adenosine deaminase-related metal-dependent hydrolase
VRALVSAAWVLPVSAPPIREGWIAVEDGIITALGPRGTSAHAAACHDADVVDDRSDAVLLPGLVNAHTHLELSPLRGRVPPAAAMPAWVRSLLAARRQSPGPDGESVARAITAMRAGGTALVGDVSNTLASCDALARSAMSALVFHEVLGFRPADPVGLVRAASERARASERLPRVRATLAAHAPYSTSPAVFAAVRDQVVAAGRPVGVHLGESPEEIAFLRTGQGAWRTLLEDLGAWDDRWTAPQCGPVEYLDRLGLLGPRLVAVHGVHLDAEELSRLAAAGATLVTCPRSNEWTGVGPPPVGSFFRSGVNVAVGTDSLASSPDLQVFAELAALRRLAPDVPARLIVRSATLGGAEALGFGEQLGSLDVGKRADVIAVRLRDATADPEESLLRGVGPEDVAWVATGQDCGGEP